jgi:hypothetical protein
MHDVGWCLDGGGSGLQFYNNEVYNMDHGVGSGGPYSGGAAVHHNHFHDMAPWDTSADSYHHDGIHFFTDNGALPNISVYKNLFDGDIGNNVTSWIYMEASSAAMDNRQIFDNVLYVAAGRNSCCGMINLYSDGGSSSSGLLANNTVFGPGVTPGTGTGMLVGSGQSNARVQNNAIAASQNIVGINSGATLTALSNNAYFSSAGSDSFSWHGSIFGSFATWVSNSGETGALFSSLATLSLGSNGQPQAGSTLIGAGANLTSLGIAELNTDILGAARPASGAWDIGAFQFGATAAAQQQRPNPPTGLTVSVR